MAAPASRLVQDRNLNIHSAGDPFGGKVDASRAVKKGAPSGRKALNDISNSAKPSSLQASSKKSSINVISTEKDIGASRTTLGVGGRANLSKAPEKGQVGGRKALGDLTNSIKPPEQNLSRKVQYKKSNATVEETIPCAIKEEKFLHDHQECIKAKRKAMDFKHFLETVGLDNGSRMVLKQPVKLKPESPVKLLEMDEMPVLLDEVDLRWKSEYPDYCSPACRSPKSVKRTNENWKTDEIFIDFKLMETPKLHNY